MSNIMELVGQMDAVQTAGNVAIAIGLDKDTVLEEVRKEMLNIIEGGQSFTREELSEKFDDVMDTKQLVDVYQVESFSAPFIIVTRRSDKALGSFMFQHSPRFYFGFKEDRP